MENSFKAEYKWPPKVCGNFLVGVSVAFGWGVSVPSGPDKGEIKVNATEISAAIEEQLTKDLAIKGSLSTSEALDKKMPDVCAAIAQGDARKFVSILGEAAKVELKFPGSAFGIPFEANFQLLGIATTPVTLKAKYDYKILPDRSSPANRPLAEMGAFIVVKAEIAILLGLSPAGWALVASRLSPQIVRTLFADAGAAIIGPVQTLIATSAFQIAGFGLLGMLTYTGAGLYAIGRESRIGDLQNIAGAGASAYVARVWGTQNRAGWVASVRLGDAITKHADSLARQHARQVSVSILGELASEVEALDFYRRYLEGCHGGRVPARERTYIKVRTQLSEALVASSFHVRN